MWMVRDAVDDLANSHGRTTRHIATGLVITGGAVALAALIAHLAKPAPEDPEAYSDYEELNPPEPPKPPSIFSTVWPPLFVALTLSGFRVWNAPSSFARSNALATTAAALAALPGVFRPGAISFTPTGDWTGE